MTWTLCSGKHPAFWERPVAAVPRLSAQTARGVPRRRVTSGAKSSVWGSVTQDLGHVCVSAPQPGLVQRGALVLSLFCLGSWDDSSSVSSGISDTIDNLSTDDINTSSSISSYANTPASSRKNLDVQVRDTVPSRLPQSPCQQRASGLWVRGAVWGEQNPQVPTRGPACSLCFRPTAVASPCRDGEEVGGGGLTTLPGKITVPRWTQAFVAWSVSPLSHPRAPVCSLESAGVGAEIQGPGGKTSAS